MYSSIFPSVFQVVTYPNVSPLSSPPYVPHAPVHLILLDFIIRKIFGEEYRSYRSYRSSLYIFLLSPLTSYPLGQNIHLSTLIKNTLIVFLFYVPCIVIC